MPIRGIQLGFRRGLLGVVLLSCAATGRAQGEGFSMEITGGMGAFFLDERGYTFDSGATAWLTDRWGLGVVALAARVVGQKGRAAALFSPAVIQYRHRLRRRRSLHLGVGPGYILAEGTHHSPRFVFGPHVDVLYGLQAAGNRRFGLRAGVRFIDYAPFAVVLGSYTFD